MEFVGKDQGVPFVAMSFEVTRNASRIATKKQSTRFHLLQIDRLLLAGRSVQIQT